MFSTSVSLAKLSSFKKSFLGSDRVRYP
jgi:hypothetical protein